MPTSDSRVRAVLVLGKSLPGELDERTRRWLGRGEIVSGGERRNPAERLLQLVGYRGGLGAPAALRYLGQTGRSPDTVLAAADPVWFEPGLDRIRCHALSGPSVTESLPELFEELNAELGDESLVFEQVDGCGYLFSSPGVAPRVPASEIDGQDPAPALPRGAPAAAYHRLMSEIQMVLHASEHNASRAVAGLPPVNALWVWGAGERPEPLSVPLPRLFSSDPLFAGIWRHAGLDSAAPPPTVDDCLGGDFVLAPDADADAAALADEAAVLLERGRLRELVVVLAAGQIIAVKRRHRLRFWRRPLPAADDRA